MEVDKYSTVLYNRVNYCIDLHVFGMHEQLEW